MIRQTIAVALFAAGVFVFARIREDNRQNPRRPEYRGQPEEAWPSNRGPAPVIIGGLLVVGAFVVLLV